jgi:hypothetical protein
MLNQFFYEPEESEEDEYDEGDPWKNALCLFKLLG